MGSKASGSSGKPVSIITKTINEIRIIFINDDYSTNQMKLTEPHRTSLHQLAVLLLCSYFRHCNKIQMAHITKKGMFCLGYDLSGFRLE
jgi:hypothetical protein